MLSQHTIAIVKQTAPVIRERGEEITSRMYDILFDTYPQTKALFSKAPNNQPEILAKSIIAYCDNIERLEALKGGLDNIARKHVAVDVHPGHYPMVGQSLLQAISDILGTDVATPEVIEAWKEAYFFLADILIDKERQLSTQQQPID